MVILLSCLGTLALTIILFNLKSPGKRIEHAIAPAGAIDSPVVMRSIGQLLGPPLVGGNLITPLTNGDEIFPAMLEALRRAERTVTFETFIYWSGDIGREFADAFSACARRGVKVNVLLDAIGSHKFDESACRAMRAAGVRVERYRPLRWYTLMRLNNRTHRKILVIDGKIGFTGGVGIADQWRGHAQDPGHWRDSHFRVEGPVVAQLQAAFLDNWNATHPEVLHGDDYFPELAARGESHAQVFKSSPEEGSGSVRLMYLYAIAHARASIRIASAYFVPDVHLRNCLAAAAARGVRIEIVVPGRHIDTGITRRASRHTWGTLLAAGVRIFEFEPTMFHCKYMVVDDTWVSVGSTNMDNRSFRLNDECNLNVFDARFARTVAATFAKDRGCSDEITLAAWRARPVGERLIETVAGWAWSQV